MRLIARSTLVKFGEKHPKAKPSLDRFQIVLKAAHWSSMNEVQAAVSGAKVLNGERARFEVSGGSYRLIVAFSFPLQIAFIKFIGTHEEYDAIDPFTVSMF